MAEKLYTIAELEEERRKELSKRNIPGATPDWERVRAIDATISKGKEMVAAEQAKAKEEYDTAVAEFEEAKSAAKEELKAARLADEEERQKWYSEHVLLPMTTEYVTKEYFDALSGEDQALLKEVGVDKFNKELQRRRDEFLATYTETGEGEYITTESFNKLSPDEQKRIKEIGATAFLTEYKASHIRLGDDTYITNEDFASMDEDLQKIALSSGMPAVREYIDANFVEVGDGEYITRESYNDLTPEQQKRIKEIGSNAFLQEFLADNVEIRDGEYVPRDAYDRLSTEDRKLIKEIGVDKFIAKFKQENVDIGGGFWMPHKGTGANRGWDDLSKQERDYLLANGIDKFNEWVSQPITVWYNHNTNVTWIYRHGEWLFNDPKDPLGSDISNEEAAGLREQSGITASGAGAATGISKAEYEQADGVGKFLMLIDADVLPEGAIYAGLTKEGEPQYYEFDRSQMTELEKKLLDDSDTPPQAGYSAYLALLMQRAGVQPASMSDTVVLQQQFVSLPQEDKNRILAVYHWQATQEEGRAIPISLEDTSLMYIHAGAEKLREVMTENYLSSVSRVPVLREASYLASSFATTIAEMTLAFPVIASKVIKNPAVFKEVALGMWDFAKLAGMGIYRKDPWAGGQMLSIIVPVFFAGKGLVGVVGKTAPKVASKLSDAFVRFDEAIRRDNPAEIRAVGEELVKIAEEARVEGVDTATVDTISTMGEKTIQQAESLSTVSVDAIDSIKLSIESAGAETVSVGKGRYTWKPEVTKARTETIDLVSERGWAQSKFDRFLRERATNPELTPELFEVKEKYQFDRMLEKATKDLRDARNKELREVEEAGVLSEQQLGQKYYKQREIEEALEQARGRELYDVRQDAKRAGLSEEEIDYYIKARVTEPDLTPERFKAADIVRKARENETQVYNMAEKAFAELDEMAARSGTTTMTVTTPEITATSPKLQESLSKSLLTKTKTELTAMTATNTDAMVNVLNRLNRAQQAQVLAKLDPELAAALSAALATKTATSLQNASSVASSIITSQALQQATEVMASTAPATGTALATGVVTDAKTTTVPKALDFSQVATDARITFKPAVGLVESVEVEQADAVEVKQAEITDIDTGTVIEDYEFEEEPPPPDEPPPRRAGPRLPSGDGGKDDKEVELPSGTILWKQGLFWRAIAPPYRNTRPMVLKQPPKGARYTYESGPGSARRTLQVLGGIPPRNVDVDLGWADIHIRGDKNRIWMNFTSGGEQTNVGMRSGSPTAGMTVTGAPTGRPGKGSLTEAMERAPYRPSIRSTKRSSRGTAPFAGAPSIGDRYRRVIELAKTGRRTQARRELRELNWSGDPDALRRMR